MNSAKKSVAKKKKPMKKIKRHRKTKVLVEKEEPMGFFEYYFLFGWMNNSTQVDTSTHLESNSPTSMPFEGHDEFSGQGGEFAGAGSSSSWDDSSSSSSDSCDTSDSSNDSCSSSDSSSGDFGGGSDFGGGGSDF